VEEENVYTKINIPIYGGYLAIHITKDIDKTLRVVDYDGDLVGDAYMVFNLDGTKAYDLIFKHDKIDHGLIAHECFHLTHRIMHDINKTFDFNNDEPEAYLMQFLINSIYDFLSENEIKIHTWRQE